LLPYPGSVDRVGGSLHGIKKKDRTICVTGLIIEHKGIPEMEAQDPGQIQFDKK
jgi:hypothetical protein